MDKPWMTSLRLICTCSSIIDQQIIKWCHVRLQQQVTATSDPQIKWYYINNWDCDEAIGPSAADPHSKACKTFCTEVELSANIGWVTRRGEWSSQGWRQISFPSLISGWTGRGCLSKFHYSTYKALDMNLIPMNGFKYQSRDWGLTV